MTHRKTYRLFDDDERELVYEDTLNQNGQILSFKDYQSPNQATGQSEYNDKDLLTCERDYTDGIEGSRTEYVYDAKGDITNRKLFVADELFEELSHEYSEKGFIRRVSQHGEEIERFVESKNEEKFVREVYQGSELIQRQNGIYDPETRIETIEYTDPDGTPTMTRYFKSDELDRVVKEEDRSPEGNLLSLNEFVYENELLISQKRRDYSYDQHSDLIYEYDSNQNLISEEVRDSTGNLLEYHKQTFDEKNRVISESGYSAGGFNAIYGTYVQGEQYTFEHEYEEIPD